MECRKRNGIPFSLDNPHASRPLHFFLPPGAIIEDVTSSDDILDVVIVGAGPTGLACGLELKRRGLRARGYKAVSLPELFRAAGYR